MKHIRFLAGLALALVAGSVFAADAAPSPASDLKALIGQVKAKIAAGQTSEAQLTPEIAAFDALLAKYAGQKTDEVAQIAFMKATLYVQVLNEPDKGKELLAKVKTDFPNTRMAQMAEQMLSSAGAEKSALVGKAAPEIHFLWASDGGLKSLSSLKGKVIVVDFWATWCEPCIDSFPHIQELVDHYKGCDVVVVGVTSIQGRVANLHGGSVATAGHPDKEIALLPEFMKEKGMTWTVAVSQEQVFNPDYACDSIPHMAIIAPDMTVRVNGLHPAVPLERKTAVIDAILKEFKMKLPEAKA